jgi:hypothetical protein
MVFIARYDNILKRWMSNKLLKPIRERKGWYLNQEIEFGCI